MTTAKEIIETFNQKEEPINMDTLKLGDNVIMKAEPYQDMLGRVVGFDKDRGVFQVFLGSSLRTEVKPEDAMLLTFDM